MKSKNLFRIITFLAICFSSLNAGSQVHAKGNAQTATPPSAVQIVTRGLTYWDAIYIGNVNSTRYENWPFSFAEAYSFSITATTTSGDLVPQLTLFDGNGNEISTTTNVLASTQPIGNYSVQVQPVSGSGTYSLTIRQIAATPTPPPTSTPASTSTPVSTNTPVPTGTAVATNTPNPTASSVPSTTPTVSNTSTPSSAFTTASFTPPTIIVGATSTGTVNLNNVPVEGYASVEFTCTYDPLFVEVSNITDSGLFGADAVMVVNGPQNGSFIVAIAGSNGTKALTGGVAFTFSAKGLQIGQSAVDCQARVSTGNLTLVTIPSAPTNLTITSAQGTFSGQVLASKPVTVTLYNPDNSIAGTVNANVDGTFSLSLSAGTYTAIASAPGYLKAQGSFTVTSGNATTPQVISLPAGDINGDDVIDQFDALTIGINYNAATPTAADLNNDGIINVLDMEILANNYHQSGALAWQ
jgi:hypothetical protein